MTSIRSVQKSENRVRTDSPGDAVKAATEARVDRMVRRLTLVTITCAFACGLFSCGGGRSKPYTTPDGYPGGRVERRSIVLDAVYMNDPAKGIEGVVRLTWWDVFNITILNESNRPVTITADKFYLVDSKDHRFDALPLDSVENYESLVLGPLMAYQRRAVRRAFWTGEPIAPGAFAVGYVFFKRHRNLRPCTLVLDPDTTRRKDELIITFSAPPGPVIPDTVATAPAIKTAPVDTAIVAPDSATATPAIADTTSDATAPVSTPADTTSVEAPSVETESGSTEPAPVPSGDKTEEPAKSGADESGASTPSGEPAPSGDESPSESPESGEPESSDVTE